MVEGAVEVVASQNEQVGLPDWSHVNVLVSAKGSIPIGYEDVGFNYLMSHAIGFLNTTIEGITRNIGIWADVAYKPDRVVLPAPDPAAAAHFVTAVEVVFSMQEQVGLPSPERGQNHNIRLMASSKMLVAAGSVDQGFAYIAQMVKKQMGEKRQMVLDNPRAWTLAQSAV